MTPVGWIAVAGAGIGAWWLFSGGSGTGSGAGSDVSAQSNTKQTTTKAGSPRDVSRTTPVDRERTSYVSPDGQVTYTEAHQLDTATPPPASSGAPQWQTTTTKQVISGVTGPEGLSVFDLQTMLAKLGAGNQAFTSGIYQKYDPTTHTYTRTPLTPEMQAIVDRLKSLGYTGTNIGTL